MWKQPDLWTKCHSSQHWQDLYSDRKSRYTSNHRPLGASFPDTSNGNTSGSNHERSITKTQTGSKHPFKQFICPRTYSTGITELTEIMGWCFAPSYWTEEGRGSTNLTQGHKRPSQLKGLQRWFQVLHNFSQKKERKGKRRFCILISILQINFINVQAQMGNTKCKQALHESILSMKKKFSLSYF